MLRRTALILGAMLLAAPLIAAADTMPLPVATYESKAFAAAQESGKPILVEIHAVWCGTCKIQKVLLDDITKKPDFKDLMIFRVDFDDQKDAVGAFGADTQSTLIVFKGKAEVARSVGETSQAAIEALLRKAI